MQQYGMAAERNARGQFKKGSHWRPPQAFRDREWLEENYVRLGKSTGDIAKEFGIVPQAVVYWLDRHKIKRRSTSEARKLKHWGQSGSDNPMWNMKGELNPRWLGGVTPERQAFYASQEWKKVCKLVKRRDKSTCQRCGANKDNRPDVPLHIHHLVSFADESLRVEPTNLVVLCEICHDWVHSRKNVNKEFIR